MTEQPLHTRLAAEWRRRIAVGEWPDGSQIPSESELGVETGASRGSVRQALATLRAEGLVVGGRGRRPVVHQRAQSQSFSSFQSFSEWAHGSGRVPGQQTVEVARRAVDAETAAQLAIHPGEPVVQLVRLRLLDGVPAMVEQTTFTLPAGRHLFDFDPDSGSIFSHLRSVGVDLHHARHTFDAVAADARDAGLLGVPVGSPLLRERRLTFSSHDVPVEYSVDHYLPAVSNIVVDNVVDRRTGLARIPSTPEPSPDPRTEKSA